MPLGPQTTDTPSTATPYADVLSNNARPALNATSDMPIIRNLNGPQAGEDAEGEGDTAPPVDTGAKPDKTDGTSGDNPEGEADGAPNKEAAGEETDKTSPQQRAAFARERNRRQAAEREAAETRAQVAKLVETVENLAKQVNPPKDDARPTREAFDDPNAYDKALEDWAGRRAADKATADAQAAQQRQEAARRTESVVNTFKERQAAFEADHPDFEDVVYADDIKISPVMSQAILEAEDGPAIAYYLGQNPEAAERISQLSPASAIREIGRISARLEAPPAKPKPAPVRPLTSRNNGGPKSPDEMSMEEYATTASPNRRKTN
jgi:hypothetical protein